jgi:hypothetical protein
MAIGMNDYISKPFQASELYGKDQPVGKEKAISIVPVPGL